MGSSFTTFSRSLSETETEEEVKSVYAKHFKLVYRTTFQHDLYSPEIFFEFKYSKPLQKRAVRAAVLAQVMYYLRRLRLGHADKVIPPTVCVADSQRAFFTETRRWQKFYDHDTRYDWDVAPSQPDPRLVDDLEACGEIDRIKVFDVLEESDFALFQQRLSQYRTTQGQFDFHVKKLITEDNFEDVFRRWDKEIGTVVRDEIKPSRYFLCDIQQGGSHYDSQDNEVIFHLSPTEQRARRILPSEYDGFWADFERLDDPAQIRNILTKVDRLTEASARRFKGEFFTPVDFARRAHRTLEKAVGAKWWTKNYRLWDMAAGTGNLEWFLPADAYPSLYLSTLQADDVQHCQRVFPGATVFQYDYLNDDVETVFGEAGLFPESDKLPPNLARDLANPEIKWIILINPPFATAQKAGYSGGSKGGVSHTAVRRRMHAQQLGEVSRELFAQFIFRIHREFAGKEAFLGLFSTLKYLNANNDQHFRDEVFRYGFRGGFVFSSANFSGLKKGNPFPVGFLVWELAKAKKLEAQKLEVEILDDDTSRIGRKLIVAAHRSQFLSKWIERPPTTEIFPPFGGAISVKGDNADVRDRVAEGFLASLMCKGNDVQNYNNVALLSGPYVSAGALSVVPENFARAMVVHAVRRNVRKNWSNDRDQFLQPSREPGSDFVRRCTVWSLFAESNQTASLRDVAYRGETFQVRNHFFPFTAAAVRGWEVSNSEIVRSLETDGEDRFVAGWLPTQALDEDEAALLALGRGVYEAFFREFKHLPTFRFKVGHWDAGWWQIKRCLAEAGQQKQALAEVEEAHRALGPAIREGALALGILTST